LQGNHCIVCSQTLSSGKADAKVFVYAAGVITIRQGLTALKNEMRGYRERGYSRKNEDWWCAAG